MLVLQLERALQLSADMQKRNVPRNVHTHSALMNVCIKCGQLRLALECWENMQHDAIEPNVVRHKCWEQIHIASMSTIAIPKPMIAI